jgi:hypothetical protein
MQDNTDDIDLRDEDQIKAEEERLIEERRKRRQAIMQKYQAKALNNVAQTLDRTATGSDNNINIGESTFSAVFKILKFSASLTSYRSWI